MGTVLLAVMGAMSYVFAVRGLSHTHELTAADLHESRPGNQRGTFSRGSPATSHQHQHEVTIDPAGQGDRSR